MTLCLLCDSELDETTKPEHVLLNALGGRKTTRCAICSDCNNRFGGTIDNELTSQVTAIRNLLQLESGIGHTAPTLKNLQAGTHKINMKGDGELELAGKPFTIEKLADGAWNVQIRARSEEHLAELVPHIAAALKIPEDRLREQLAAAQGSFITQRPGIIHHALSFGGPDAIRSIVKSGLILWSALVGNDEVRSAPYDRARQFVMNGGQLFNRDQTHLDSRFFEDVERMKAGFGPLFNLIYVRSDTTGRVVGHFTLYNMVAWQFVLAESGGTPSSKIALISNPLDPRQWSDRAAEDFDVPFEWLNNPDYSDEMARSKARVEAVLEYYVKSSTKMEHQRIIEECLKKVDLVPDEPIPQEKGAELAKLISTKFVHHAFSLRYEEKILPERMAEIFARKKDS